jgi:hypothetical protein
VAGLGGGRGGRAVAGRGGQRKVLGRLDGEGEVGRAPRVKKVWDLIYKSQDGTYYLSAGGGGDRGAEGPHGQVDEGGDGFCV